MEIDAKGLINFICYRQFLLLPRTMYVVSSTQLLTMHDCESECDKRLKQFRSTHLTMHPDRVSACTKFGAKHVTYMVRDISKQTD